MPSTSAVARLRGARVGLILGGALALVGLAVGGTMATSTTNPYVYVANPSSSPVPVVGSVGITNPGSSPVPVSLQGTGSISGDVNASQKGTWTVGITGTPTINVGSGQVTLSPATKFFGTGRVHLDSGGDNIAKAFGQTINVTAVALDNSNGIDAYSDTIEVLLASAQYNVFVPIRVGDGSALITLPQPIPADQINFACLNSVEACDFFATVVGY